MTNIGRNAHKMSAFFARSRRKRCVVDLKIDRLPPVKTKKRADVLGGSFREL
jgi:hypothetical protein